MDRIDDRIVRELVCDGRLSNVELARRVGLSASACLRRVQELERCGTITGYRAVIDPAARGVGLVAYVAIGLSDHTQRAQQALERAVAAAEEVRECHNITGTVEYLLRVEVRGVADYKRFHADVIGALPQVTTIQTWVVMDSPKDERA